MSATGYRGRVRQFRQREREGRISTTRPPLLVTLERRTQEVARLRQHPTEVPMRRIGLVVVLAVGLTLPTLAAKAQETAKKAHVGVCC